ncbi:MAG: hypothetical protein R3D67_07350 [Hyphomicrobiaceae bacterium]
MIIEKLATLAVLASTKTNAVLGLLGLGIALSTTKAHRLSPVRSQRQNGLISRLYPQQDAITVPAAPLTRDGQWNRLCMAASIPSNAITTIYGQQNEAAAALAEVADALQDLYAELAQVSRLNEAA